jgi:hypothetical protein
MPDTLFDLPPAAEAKDPRPMLTLMAQLGMGRQWIAAMVEVLCPDIKLSADDRRFLAGPICVHGRGGGWNEDIPKWMFEQADAERVEILFGGAPWIIGPTELAAVMYCAMMDAPRHSDIVDLYLWAATTASARHYNRPIEDLWKQLDMRPIADDEVLERGGRLWQDYQALADEARRKSIAAAHGQEREAQKETKERDAWIEEEKQKIAGVPKPPARKPVERQQFAFF